MKAPDIPGYTVARPLLGGGMADLFVAHDHQRRRVVIRCLKPAYARDRKIVKRFMASASILARLDHPHIAKCLDARKKRGSVYMIREYVDARNLRKLILNRDPLLAENTLSLIRQIAGALQYIHASGYLHLDIKPENILVDDNGHVTLIDFDLAMPRRGRAVKLKQLPGTPAYLPPETLAQHTVDEQTDIYSLGVTCFEMLTYHKPFEADTQERATALQMDPAVEPTPMREYNRQVPGALETILCKCLAKEPARRYPSMSLVVRDLEAIL